MPVFLGLSFYGNASVEKDSSIPHSRGWMRPHRTAGAVEDNRPTEQLRGISSHRWPLKSVLESGYGVATFYEMFRTDIASRADDRFDDLWRRTKPPYITGDLDRLRARLDRPADGRDRQPAAW